MSGPSVRWIDWRLEQAVKPVEVREITAMESIAASGVKCVGLAPLELENVADECQSIRPNWILRAVSMVASIIANARGLGGGVTGNSA